MARSKEALEEINRKLTKLALDGNVGLGAVIILFDARGPADRSISVGLLDVSPGDAVRILHRCADSVMAKEMEEEDKKFIIPPFTNYKP